MTKRRSKSLFVVFTIILVICLIACFVNFTYPFTLNGNYYSYSSFTSNLKLGQDIGNSLRIVYRADADEDVADSNYNNLRNSTITDLQNIIKAEGYDDLTITEYGDDSIVVVVGNLINKEEEDAIVGLISNPSTITFSKNSDGSDPFANGRDLKSIEPAQMNTMAGLVYYVEIQFSDEIKDEMIKANAESDIYVTQNGATLKIEKGDENVAKGILTLFGNPEYTSLSQVTTSANNLRLATLDLTLTQTSCDLLPPTYGVGSGLFILIGMAILVVAAFVFLIVKYKALGLLASYTLTFFVVLALFFLQSIPAVHINFAGAIAMMICFILAVEGIVNIIESAKKHYQENTKLYVALKMAQKENMARTFIMNLLVCLLGLVCLWMPSSVLSSFGWVAFVVPFVTVFTTLVLMKLFINMYLALNSTNGQKCNFHKGGKNA